MAVIHNTKPTISLAGNADRVLTFFLDATFINEQRCIVVAPEKKIIGLPTDLRDDRAGIPINIADKMLQRLLVSIETTSVILYLQSNGVTSSFGLLRVAPGCVGIRCGSE